MSRLQKTHTHGEGAGESGGGVEAEVELAVGDGEGVEVLDGVGVVGAGGVDVALEHCNASTCVTLCVTRVWHV